MTILVTGGAGFIGSNFVYHLLDKHPEDRVVCVDCLTYAGNLSTLEKALENPNFRFCKTNICDREGIYKISERKNPLQRFPTSTKKKAFAELPREADLSN